MDIDGDSIPTKDEIRPVTKTSLVEAATTRLAHVCLIVWITVEQWLFRNLSLATLNSDLLHSGNKLRNTFNKKADTDGSG
jgi:hypothetical protein